GGDGTADDREGDGAGGQLGGEGRRQLGVLADARDDAGPPALGPAVDGGREADAEAGELAVAGEGEEAAAEGLAGAVEGDVGRAGAAAQLLGDVAAGVALGPQREGGLVAGVELAEGGPYEGL